MWQVSILFEGVWWGIGPNYTTKDEAEWAIVKWLHEHGCNGSSVAFSVEQLQSKCTGDELCPLHGPNQCPTWTTDDILKREG